MTRPTASTPILMSAGEAWELAGVIMACLLLGGCGGRQAQTYVDTYLPTSAQIEALDSIGDTGTAYQEITIDHVTLRLHPMIQTRIRTSDQTAPSNPAEGVALAIDEDGMHGSTGGSRGSTSADLWSSWYWQIIGFGVVLLGGVLIIARRVAFASPWLQAVTNATPAGTGWLVVGVGAWMIYAEALSQVAVIAVSVVLAVIGVRWLINTRRERERQQADAPTDRYPVIGAHR